MVESTSLKERHLKDINTISQGWQDTARIWSELMVTMDSFIQKQNEMAKKQDEMALRFSQLIKKKKTESPEESSSFRPESNVSPLSDFFDLQESADETSRNAAEAAKATAKTISDNWAKDSESSKKDDELVGRVIMANAISFKHGISFSNAIAFNQISHQSSSVSSVIFRRRFSIAASSFANENREFAIVGGGKAAGYAAKTFVEHGLADGKLCMVSKEAYAPYERPALTKAYWFPLDKKPARLPGFHTCVGGGGERQTPDWYKEKGIEMLHEDPVAGIDTEKQTLTTNSGKLLKYGSLIIATGCTASRFPDKIGGNLHGVHYGRDVADANSLISSLEKSKKVVVVGGGYMGMEVAAATVAWKLDTTIIFPEDHLMTRLFTLSLAQKYEDLYKEYGVNFVKGASIKSLEAGSDGRVSGVKLGDVRDIGFGKGKYYSLNVPLDDGIDDDSYQSLFKSLMSKVMETFKPGAVVLQCGADSLSGDRLGCFNLSIKGVALGIELEDKMPGHQYYEYFGPDYNLHVAPSNMENKNSRLLLEEIKSKPLFTKGKPKVIIQRGSDRLDSLHSVKCCLKVDQNQVWDAGGGSCPMEQPMAI